MRTKKEQTNARANNQTQTSSFTVIEPDSNTISNTVANTSSNNNNGAIDITPSGGTPPYSFYWNTYPTQTTEDINNLSAGTYVIDVIDLTCGDVTQLTITITEPDPLTINTTTSGDNSSCDPNICNGIFGVAVNGETSPYTFTWNAGGYTDSMATDLCAGTYNISITDANGCNLSLIHI